MRDSNSMLTSPKNLRRIIGYRENDKWFFLPEKSNYLPTLLWGEKSSSLSTSTSLDKEWCEKTSQRFRKSIPRISSCQVAGSNWIDVGQFRVFLKQEKIRSSCSLDLDRRRSFITFCWTIPARHFWLLSNCNYDSYTGVPNSNALAFWEKYAGFIVQEDSVGEPIYSRLMWSL